MGKISNILTAGALATALSSVFSSCTTAAPQILRPAKADSRTDYAFNNLEDGVYVVSDSEEPDFAWVLVKDDIITDLSSSSFRRLQITTIEKVESTIEDQKPYHTDPHGRAYYLIEKGDFKGQSIKIGAETYSL